MRTGRAMGFNMVLRQVIKSTVEGNYPDYAINYLTVNLAVGLLAIAKGSINAQQYASLLVTWDTEPNSHNGYADDKITILICDPETNIYKNGL